MEENEKTSAAPEFDGHEETPTEAPQEPTPSVSLEEIAKAYNMTPEQVIKSYGEAQKKITQQGQELSTVRKNYQWADQFAHEINTRKGLREHIESFFDARDEVPSEVKGAIDPVYHRVNQVETELASMKMNAKISEIGSKFPMNEDVRRQIFEEVIRTKSDDVEAHYWKIMGPNLISNSQTEKRNEAISERNRDAYVRNRGGAPKTKATDIASLPKAEWSNALQDELDSLFRRTD